MARNVLGGQAGVLALLMLAAIMGLRCFSNIEPAASKGTVSPFPSISLSKPTASPGLSAASPVVSNDSNWAGYIVASDLQNPQSVVTNVSASWIVPTVAPSFQNTFSAVWIGIGGFFDTTLIQAGTEQDFFNGVAGYSAWFELLPQLSTTIDTMIVSPGDEMRASISLVNPNTNDWSIVLQDVTGNQTFQSDFLYAASRLSAEWVVERPVTGGRITTLAVLADVGLVTLTNCTANVGNGGGSIGSFPAVQSVMYDTVQSNGDGVGQLVVVSNLQSDGFSFSVQTSPSMVPELLDLSVLPSTLAAAALAIPAKRLFVKRAK